MSLPCSQGNDVQAVYRRPHISDMRPFWTALPAQFQQHQRLHSEHRKNGKGDKVCMMLPGTQKQAFIGFREGPLFCIWSQSIEPGGLCRSFAATLAAVKNPVQPLWWLTSQTGCQAQCTGYCSCWCHVLAASWVLCPFVRLAAPSLTLCHQSQPRASPVLHGAECLLVSWLL